MLKHLAAIVAVALVAGALAFSAPPTVQAGATNCNAWTGSSIHHTGPPTNWRLSGEFQGCGVDTVLYLELHKHDSNGWHFLWRDSYTVPLTNPPPNDIVFVTHDYVDTCSNADNYAVVAWWSHGSNTGAKIWGPLTGLNACN
jgi:hypothetical protein